MCEDRKHRCLRPKPHFVLCVCTTGVFQTRGVEMAFRKDTAEGLQVSCRVNVKQSHVVLWASYVVDHGVICFLFHSNCKVSPTAPWLRVRNHERTHSSCSAAKKNCSNAEVVFYCSSKGLKVPALNSSRLNYCMAFRYQSFEGELSITAVLHFRDGQLLSLFYFQYLPHDFPVELVRTIFIWNHASAMARVVSAPQHTEQAMHFNLLAMQCSVSFV